MKTIINRYIFLLTIATIVAVSSCVKDPYEDVISNERSIEAVYLPAGYIQVGAAEIDRTNGTVKVAVLMEDDTDLSNIAPIVQASARAKTAPESGEPLNFEASNNMQTYTVTSESGQTREWVVELVPFIETLPGIYKITGQTLYGGTGPEWGCAEVFDLTAKDVWAGDVRPNVESDNMLEFTLEGATPEGHTYGTVINSAGNDGKYAEYLFKTSDGAIDVNHFFRKVPKGEGTWLRNYTDGTITFTFPDGSKTVGSFIGADIFEFVFAQPDNGFVRTYSKTVTGNALHFKLNGADDWTDACNDINKVVKTPREFWIDLEKQ